ncbi:DUF1292 domain-containing protein [Clostridium polynesiense]|uniref:DUF1292 domain-containing protein n=1 Tax=Clostridium polynesiense TaxID=1325933 RepID=UPI0005911B1A|nr:DUF1292 domain-containing protein [Clostridium polynesiense]
MDDREIMKFKDEEGNLVELEAVARIYLEEMEYLILAPLEGSEDDAYVFRVDNKESGIEYNLVEDDEEFNNVKKEYKNLLYKKD